jgi:hypothetical protein
MSPQTKQRKEAFSDEDANKRSFKMKRIIMPLGVPINV